MLKRVLSPPHINRRKYDVQTRICADKRLKNAAVIKANASHQYAVSYRKNMNENNASARVNNYAGGFTSFLPYSPYRKGES